MITSQEQKVTYCSFNQECSIVNFGTIHGFNIYDVSPFDTPIIKKRYGKKINKGVSIIENLFKTNVAAFVENVDPKSIVLWDDKDQKIIAKIVNTYDTLQSIEPERGIHAIKFTKGHILCIMYNKLNVYSLDSLNPICSLEIFPQYKISPVLCIYSIYQDPQDTMILSHIPCKPDMDDFFYVVPATSQGYIRVGKINQNQEYIIFKAHTSKIVATTISKNGDKIATASEKGTVIRVFNKKGECLNELRRGHYPSLITNLSFEIIPREGSPIYEESNGIQWLLVMSDGITLWSNKSTLHLFDLNQSGSSFQNPTSQIKLWFNTKVALHVAISEIISLANQKILSRHLLYNKPGKIWIFFETGKTIQYSLDWTGEKYLQTNSEFHLI